MSKASKDKKKLRAIKNANQPGSIPDYLLKQPDVATSIPPVHTRPQLLPFHELTWENFERLCKSLIEMDHEIRSCHLYGRPGQNQKGIDLIAYPRDFQSRRPRVYQCKRVDTFGRTHINGVVDRFLKSKWKPHPTHFVICCKASLSSTECQDEILKQARRLQEDDIVFEHWDAESLSTKLKDSPKIVDDFFSREWVRLFIGPEAADALERRFQPAAGGVGIHRSDQLAGLIVSKELELQNLKSTLDVELSGNCDRIKDKYKEGRHSVACKELQTYIDRFQTDLHKASPVVRAKFWYTLGVLSWNANGAERAQECLENAQKIDSTFDVRPLEARVLFASREYDKALKILQPVDTLPVFTLSLAIFLDLGRVREFDDLWGVAPQGDSVASQLLACRYRLDRRFAEARDAIRTAIDHSPHIPSHNVTAGHIIFWEAVPEHLDPAPRVILPATFHRIFFRPTNLQVKLLNEAVDFYDHAIAQLSRFGGEEAEGIREIQGFRLLCLSYQPHRQTDAKRLALQLLQSDPINFPALFYCTEWGIEFNIAASVSALEERRANKRATLDQIYGLTELYKHQGKPELAIEVLNTARESFSQEKDGYLWNELMMEVLVKTNPAAAMKFVEDYQSKDSILKKRLSAVLYDRLGDHSNLEQIGVQLWQDSKELLDLLNLCGFFRKTEQWRKLEPFAKQLVGLSPDPVSVSMIVHALYHNDKFAECLSELEKHVTPIFDAKLPDELRRIEIECLFRLNRLDNAVKHLETMLQEHPSSGVVHNAAQAYFRLGKREQAMAVLKQASNAPWADSTIRIEATQLLVNEDPAEAFRLAEKVKEESPSDQGAWLNYIETGFMTGHDREASETLAIFQERFPESSLLQRFTFSDLLERERKWQEIRAKRWELYRAAQVPVHGLMDAETQPLGVEWSMRFRSNRAVNPRRQKYPVFVKHGGRAAFEPEVDTQGVIADYTALLIAHELNLLQVVEKTFFRIVIPPSLLVVLQADIHKARQFQPSRLQSLQAVKTAIDSGKISVSPDIITDDLLSRFKVEEIGVGGVRLFCLAAKSGGMVFAGHLGKHPEADNTLDEELLGKRVFPREVVTALWRLGAVAQAELQAAVEIHSKEPCRDDIINTLLKRPPLITDHLTLESLTTPGLLGRVTETFAISLPKTEADYFRYSLEAYDSRQAAGDWLDELRRHISEGLDRIYHFPSFSMEIGDKESKGPNMLLLEEVSRIAQVQKLPVWIDDRFVHQYEHMENSPLLGTMDLLTFLKQQRAISDKEYFQYINRLLELKAEFLPLHGEAVQYFLDTAERTEGGSIRESYELKIIRRYYSGNFLKDTALCMSSPGPGKLPEFVLYYQKYQSSCRALLVDIWCSDASKEDKEAFSHWILGRLWKGIEEIHSVIPNPPSLLDSLAISQFPLVGITFEILLREMPNGEMSSLYLNWLYDRYLKVHWMNNPDVKRRVIDRTAAFLKDMITTRENELQAALTAQYASALAKAPSEISEGLLTTETLRDIFKDYVQRTIKISDELQVSVEKWHKWVIESIAAPLGTKITKLVNERALDLDWQEPSPFLAGLRVQVVADNGKVNHHTRLHPFIKLHHPLTEARQNASDKLFPFLELSPEKIAELRAGIARETDYESVAKEIESIAESSWKFFWERLASFVKTRVPIDVEFLLPSDPAIFTTHFTVSPIASEHPEAFRTEWRDLMVKRFRTEGVGMWLQDLMDFPFGEDISPAEIIKILIDAGNIHPSQVFEPILQLANTMSNPVVLANCLDVLLALQDNSIDCKAEIKTIVERLLDPKAFMDPVSMESLYDLYSVALRFAWRRMEVLGPFNKYSAKTRTIWAYAYAGRLLRVMDGLRENEKIVLDYDEFACWLKGKTEEQWNTIFQGAFFEQLDVTHPMRAGCFRLTVAGTLSVLIRHKAKLDWLRQELLKQALSIGKDIVEGRLRGGEESLKSFRSTRNFFGSNFNQNPFSSLRTIFEWYGEDNSSVLNDVDQQLIKVVKEFDPISTLKAGLDKVLSEKKWELNELVLLYNAFDEPLTSIEPKQLKQAMAHLDLSRQLSDQNFSLACGTLARCVNALNDDEMRQQILGKLENAWIQIAKTASDYLAILNAVLVICSNSNEPDNGTKFYGWWQEALLKTKDNLPEAVFEVADALRWGTAIIGQNGLFQTRCLLTTLG